MEWLHGRQKVSDKLLPARKRTTWLVARELKYCGAHCKRQHQSLLRQRHKDWAKHWFPRFIRKLQPEFPLTVSVHCLENSYHHFQSPATSVCTQWKKGILGQIGSRALSTLRRAEMFQPNLAPCQKTTAPNTATQGLPEFTVLLGIKHFT